MKDVVIKLEKDPNNYNLNLDLGLWYLKEKNYEEAKKIFTKLVKIDDQRYEGFLNLSIILLQFGDSENSELILKKYLKKNNYNKEIISALCSIYYNNNDFIRLSTLVDKYINIETNYLLFYFKSIISEKENNIENQKEFLIKSINENKIFWLSYEKLLNLYERTNKIDDFSYLISVAKKIFKNNPKLDYYFALSLFRKNEIELALKEITLNQLEKKFFEKLNPSYLINLYDLLSKIYVKQNKYKLSLDYSIKRNSISIKSEDNKQFNKEKLLDTIKTYKVFYHSLKKTNDIDNNNTLFHENLVFLVGFPRSGTTLLDSILRSHSKTQVLEEKPYLIDIRHEYFKNNTLENFSNISKNDIISLQKKYFSSFNYFDKNITIDKFPLNLIELGFIKKVFPRSKIILVLRHPLDSILSCVLTSFKINEAMANYENLETAAYFYNEVFELFNIYKNSFNFSFYQIKYENIVENFYKEIKNLLYFLNLEYEDTVKNYHLTAKERDKINTPSYHQVIRPIYKSSINRYKNYSETKKIKGQINKWINEFGY